MQHTLSPAYFDAKFKKLGIEGQYLTFPIEDISQLPGIISSHPDLIGFNVTHPYKEAIIPYLLRKREFTLLVHRMKILLLITLLLQLNLIKLLI